MRYVKISRGDLWSNGWHSYFVFRRSRVKISVRIVAILTEVLVILFSSSTQMLGFFSLKFRRPSLFFVTLLPLHSLFDGTHFEVVTVSLTLRRLMSYIYIYIYIYIYGAPILDVSRSHTTTQHSR